MWPAALGIIGAGAAWIAGRFSKSGAAVPVDAAPRLGGMSAFEIGTLLVIGLLGFSFLKVFADVWGRA